MPLVEKHVFLLRRNRAVVEMSDIREGNPRYGPRLGRERMDIEIPGHALVLIPLHVVRIGVNDKALADAVRAIDVQHDLEIEIMSPENIERDVCPADVKQFVEIVRARRARPESCVDRQCVSFSERHIAGPLF